jgi:anti-sigma regulatory factor (Ser/Thr protein kinase)
LFAEALPAAPPDARAHEVRGPELAPAREFVRSNAGDLAPDRREDLVLAANEVVANSFQHGGGQCHVAMWDEEGSVVCDVQDAGYIADPLVGRLAPAAEAPAGRGLWLANHLCDLVQIRSSHAGTTVRLRIDR